MYKYKNNVIKGNIEPNLFDLFIELTENDLESAILEYLQAREQINYKKITHSFPEALYPKYKHSRIKCKGTRRMSIGIEFTTLDRIITLKECTKESDGSILNESIIYKVMRSL